MLRPQVLESEAVRVLCALEAAGVTVVLQADGRLELDHVDGVPPALVAAVRAHRDHVGLLAAWLLPEVQARYAVFAARVAEADPAVVLPVLVFRPAPWEAGRCWSCGDTIGSTRPGRCFFCRAAWYLIVNQPIPVIPADSPVAEARIA